MRTRRFVATVLAASVLLCAWTLAAQLVSDTFTAPDGGLGANWTTAATTSAPAIAADMVTGGGGDSVAVWTQVGAWTNPTDYYSEISPVSIAMGDNGGPVVRFSTAAETGYQFNVVGALATSQTATIFQIIAGSYTSLGTATTTVNSNDVLHLEVSGTGATVTLVAKVNGSTLITATDSSAGRIVTAGKPGFLISGVTGTTFDNWAAGDLTGGGGGTVSRNGLILRGVGP